MSEGDGKVSGRGSEGSSGLNLMRFKVYKVTFVFLLILNLFFFDGLCDGILKDIQSGQAGNLLRPPENAKRMCGVFYKSYGMIRGQRVKIGCVTPSDIERHMETCI